MELVLILAFVITACAVAIVSHSFSRQARIQRVLRRAPRSTTRTFDERQVGALQGTLEYLERPLVAPLSGRTCAYYQAVVIQRRGKRWVEIVREAAAVDCLLRDEDGVAVIKLPGAEVSVVKDSHYKSGYFEDASPVLEQFLNRHGTSSRGWIFSKDLRFREGVLEAGETFAVCGRGVYEPDPSPGAARGGYRDQSTRLVMSGTPELPLHASDDPSTLR